MIEGRYIHRWNNMGSVVDDEWKSHCISSCDCWVRVFQNEQEKKYVLSWKSEEITAAYEKKIDELKETHENAISEARSEVREEMESDIEDAEREGASRWKTEAIQAIQFDIEKMQLIWTAPEEIIKTILSNLFQQ